MKRFVIISVLLCLTFLISSSFKGLHIANKYLIGWTKDANNPLVDPGDSKVWPAIIYDSNNFHLYMGHWSDNSDITYWTSADGENFIEHANSPVITCANVSTEWSETIVALEPHSVISWNSEFWLYFGANDAYDEWKVGYASSSDLLNWTICSAPVLEIEGVELQIADPHTVIFRGKIYLYYVDGSALNRKVKLAYSSDGINFTKYGTIWEHSSISRVISERDRITGLIQDRETEGYPLKAVCSIDGINFNEYSGNPVFERDPEIDWEAQNLGHGDICKVGDTYWLYYVGKDPNNYFRLGRASTSTMVIKNE